MSNEYAIRVKDVTKLYKLYERPKDRVIDALGLTKKKLYKEHYALKNLSFDIKRGETVGIIGTNGAGKSTILKIITGVLNQTEGELEINGRISALLELGAGFNPEYSGIENVYLNGSMNGFTREEIDEKMQDILDFADIGDFVHQPVKTYSSGMFVRLAFAVAINIEPEILIVDEALSVGDAFFQAKCYKKFEDFKKEGRTILLVSHDLGSVSRYCDRVVLMNKGQKLAEGAPREMIDLYKKVMVNQIDVDAVQSGKADITSTTGQQKLTNQDNTDDNLWRSHFDINPDLNEYGNGAAEIIDFAVRDENGTLTTSILKESYFEIQSKVRFAQKIDNPIFTYTIKNLQGVNITGTNTMFEKEEIGTVHPGDVCVATFRQKMNLQGGEYLLSISCTGYKDGEFTVFHRLYDVLNISVISDKNTVGFYDMESEVHVERVEE